MLRSFVAFDSYTNDFLTYLQLDMDDVARAKEEEEVTGEVSAAGPSGQNSTNDVDGGKVCRDVTQLAHGPEAISDSDIGRLKLAGYHTIEAVLSVTKKNLARTTRGLNEAKCAKILEAAARVLSGANPMLTAKEIQTTEMFHVSTGSVAIDQLLGGGIESGSLTEVCGAPHVGKTQLAYTLAVSAQVARDGYVPGKVIFCDVEGTFRVERIRSITKRFEIVDIDRVLEGIYYIKVYSSEHQSNVLGNEVTNASHDPFTKKLTSIFFLECNVLASQVEKRLREENGRIRIIIVDSLIARFRVDYHGRTELASRQGAIGAYLKRLQEIAKDYNVAVFLTNQVVADFNAGSSIVAPVESVSEQHKACGGHVLGHSITTRLKFTVDRAQNRLCELYGSPDHPEGEVSFRITEGGITD